MVLFVVIALVFLEQPAQHHGTGDEHQEGCHNDHAHGDEEEGQGGQRTLDGHGHVIGRCQQHNSAEAQQVVGSGRLFTGVLAFQQGHGAESPELNQPFQKNQQENNGKQENGIGKCFRVDGEVVGDFPVDDPHQPQLRQLGQCNAPQKPRAQGGNKEENVLPQQQQAQISLAHAQNVVKTEFLLPSAHEEGIGIEQENDGKQRHDPGSQPQHLPRGSSACHGHEQRHGGKIVDDVEHHDHSGAGEQVGKIQPLVLADALDGQSRIEAQSHARSPPVASMVSVSEIF